MKQAMFLSLMMFTGISTAQVKVAEIPAAGPAPLQYSKPSASENNGITESRPNQGQKQAQVTGVAEKPKDGTEGLPREVFNQIVSQQLPLSPDDIKKLHSIEDKTKQAHAARTRVMPAPISSTMSQDFSSGNVPSLIRLAPDFTTSLVFVDSSGAPWNVARVIVGNKKAVNIPELEGAVGAALKTPTNIITLSPTEDYISTNISILLEGAPSPINYILSSGQPAVDMRIDILLRTRGPNAVAPVASASLGTISIPSEFSGFLDGIAPKGSVALKADNPDVKAWIYGDKMVVRTKIAIKSPFIFRRVTGADETTVFEVARSSAIVGTLNGRMITIGISGFPPPQIEALAKLQNGGVRQ